MSHSRWQSLLFSRLKEQAEAAAMKEKEVGRCWMGNVTGSHLLPLAGNGVLDLQVGPRCRVVPIVFL